MNIRFSDLDAMGHVNNAKYLTYLEEARIDYLNNILCLSNNRSCGEEE
ncbi:MAG: thioesterase family protein [Bacteroidetes bacterium]|nr:thioesterase family protein [Bacteroidota bacterium]